MKAKSIFSRLIAGGAALALAATMMPAMSLTALAADNKQPTQFYTPDPTNDHYAWSTSDASYASGSAPTITDTAAENSVYYVVAEKGYTFGGTAPTIKTKIRDGVTSGAPTAYADWDAISETGNIAGTPEAVTDKEAYKVTVTGNPYPTATGEQQDAAFIAEAKVSAIEFPITVVGVIDENGTKKQFDEGLTTKTSSLDKVTVETIEEWTITAEAADGYLVKDGTSATAKIYVIPKDGTYDPTGTNPPASSITEINLDTLTGTKFSGSANLTDILTEILASAEAVDGEEIYVEIEVEKQKFFVDADTNTSAADITGEDADEAAVSTDGTPDIEYQTEVTLTVPVAAADGQNGLGEATATGGNYKAGAKPVKIVYETTPNDAEGNVDTAGKEGPTTYEFTEADYEKNASGEVTGAIFKEIGAIDKNYTILEVWYEESYVIVRDDTTLADTDLPDPYFIKSVTSAPDAEGNTDDIPAIDVASDLATATDLEITNSEDFTFVVTPLDGYVFNTTTPLTIKKQPADSVVTPSSVELKDGALYVTISKDDIDSNLVIEELPEAAKANRLVRLEQEHAGLQNWPYNVEFIGTREGTDLDNVIKVAGGEPITVVIKADTGYSFSEPVKIVQFDTINGNQEFFDKEWDEWTNTWVPNPNVTVNTGRTEISFTFTPDPEVDTTLRIYDVLGENGVKPVDTGRQGYDSEPAETPVTPGIPAPDYPTETRTTNAGVFTDLVKDSVHNDDIVRAANLGLIKGIGNNRFNPLGILNRAEAATLIHRALGTVAPTKAASKFVDNVPPLHVDHRNAILYLEDVSPAIVKGITDSRYEPYWNVTRAMFATFIWRAGGEKSPSGSHFNDLTEDWYRNAVNWCQEQGIVKGYNDSTFGPNDVITREQAASILVRAYDKGVFGKAPASSGSNSSTSASSDSAASTSSAADSSSADASTSSASDSASSGESTSK